MLEEIKNINPKEITDNSQLQDLLSLLINVIESQACVIADLRKENQDLRNELNRLKGEHGDFSPRPSKTSRSKRSANRKNKNNKKGGKRSKIIIDRTVKCEIDKSVLPPDAKFKGYDTVVQQDLVLKRENVLFEIPVYYSKREQKTYRGVLPMEYEGQFGGQLKSFIQLLHHYCDVTEGRLKALLDNIGIHISTGTINNIILSNREEMKQESRDILRSGLEYITYTQCDGTKSWQAGQGKATQIICTPYYSVYHTMSSKSKANIIWALQGKPGQSIPLVYNKLTVNLLAASKVAQKDQKLLSQLCSLGENYSLENFESLLADRAPHLLEKTTYPKVVESLALAHYLTQTDFPKVVNLLTDAGPEYTGIAVHHALCWIHEERHYKKMMPKLKINQEAVQKVRTQIWDFYKKLLMFKELPPDLEKEQKQKLEQGFDEIFTQKTDYNELQNRLEKTFSKKEKLLRVLNFPNLPLHNNTAELAVRRKVRKRDISIHTMSVKGTEAQDAFMSVIETAAKLGVNALDYLYDRINNKFSMMSLAELIKLKTL